MSFSNFSPKINCVFCGYLFCLLFAILALVHDHGGFFWATEMSVWMRHDCIREPSRPCCVCLSYLFPSFETSLPWLYWQLQTFHFKITRFNAKVFEKYSLRTCLELQNPFSHIPTPTQRYRKAGSTGAGRTCRSSSRLQFRARSTIWPCNLKCCNSKHFETQTRRRFVSLPCLQCIYISLLLIPSLRHFCLFGTAAPVCKTGKATKCYYPTGRNKMTRFCMRNDAILHASCRCGILHSNNAIVAAQ